MNDNSNIRLAGSVAEYEYGPAADLIKRVLDNLMDCRAELVSLKSPWVCPVARGWFYVYCIRSGTCQLTQGSFVKPLRIQSGDTIILPRCREHRLRDSHTTSWSDSNEIAWFDESPRRNRTDDGNPRDATNIVVSRFPRPSREINLVLDALPECFVYRRCETEIARGPESIIAVLEQEVRQLPPCQRIVEHLVKALILQATRPRENKMSAQQNAGKTAVTDHAIARALKLMRSRPEMAWTVATLATAIGVSRSTFAARFVDQVGMTPLNYLRRERMQQAAELLCDQSLGIKEVAILVGYSSESAFSNTFKQCFGVAPGSFRRDR